MVGLSQVPGIIIIDFNLSLNNGNNGLGLHNGESGSVKCYLLFVPNSETNAKKYYPTYRKPGQLLQVQPQQGLQYSHQPYQSPLVSLHAGNEVVRRQTQLKQKQNTKMKFPNYPNVHSYSYNKARPANSIRATARDNDDDNTDEDGDDNDTNSTTKAKGPRQPTVGGFSLLLFGKPNGTESTKDGEEEEEDGEPPPFGFTEVELTLIPGVKYKIQRLPDWFGAQVQLSYPITFYFEKLDFPEDSPPFPFGRRLFQSPLFNHRRRVDYNHRNKRSILSLPPTNTLGGSDRAHLLPRLENLLHSTAGIKNARECLLRLVCEVHENQVHNSHGFIGELLTLVLSISRSSHSATHLPSYLEAEHMGKAGNCSMYEQSCSHSLFGLNQYHEDRQQCERKGDCMPEDYDFGSVEDEDGYDG